MTFEELKTTLCKRAAKFQVCHDIYVALNSENEIELIKNCRHLIEWLWLNRILDNELLSEFSEENLNAAGIYTQGNFEIDGQSFEEIYIFQSAALTITMNKGVSEVKVVHLGEAALTVNISNSSYINIKTLLSSSAIITMTGASSANIISKDVSSITLNINDDSMSEIEMHNKATAAVEAYGNAVCVIRGFDTSNTTYNQMNDSFFRLTKTQNAQINALLT